MNREVITRNDFFFNTNIARGLATESPTFSLRWDFPSPNFIHFFQLNESDIKWPAIRTQKNFKVHSNFNYNFSSYYKLNNQIWPILMSFLRITHSLYGSCEWVHSFWNRIPAQNSTKREKKHKQIQCKQTKIWWKKIYLVLFASWVHLWTFCCWKKRRKYNIVA